MSETVVYTVPAIHCAHCAMSIREEVSEVDGVEDVAVDLDTKVVTISGRRARRRSAPCGHRGSRIRGRVSSTATRERATRVDLALEGMTCAACANRIERKLNKLDGVDASVNYATEQAAVSFDPAQVDCVGSPRSGRSGRVSRGARERGRRGRRPRRRGAEAARRRGSAHRAARRARHGRAAPLPWMGMARFRSRDTCRLLGRLRLPSRGSAERAPRGGDDGHADLDRNARGVGVVRRCARARRRRGRLLRGRRRHHDADPPRPLPRGSCASALRRGDSSASPARREGSTRPARRRRGVGADRRALDRRRVRRPPRREDRDRRCGRRGRIGGRPVDAHRRAGARRCRVRGHRRRRDGQHVRSPSRPCDEGR